MHRFQIYLAPREKPVTRAAAKKSLLKFQDFSWFDLCESVQSKSRICGWFGVASEWGGVDPSAVRKGRSVLFSVRTHSSDVGLGKEFVLLRLTNSC